MDWFKNKLTIVIQGKLSDIGLKNLSNYTKYGKVIISTWAGDNFNKFPLDKYNLNNIKIVKNKSETRLYNFYNIGCQTVSTLGGIKASWSDWVIKIRCDESYSDLSKFISIMKSNPNKITTNNVFFRKDCDSKFHISDHVIGGTYKNMRGLFNKVYKNLIEFHNREYLYGRDFSIGTLHTKIPYPVNSAFNFITPEQIIALSYLQFKKVKIEREKSIPIMKKYFECVDVMDMGDCNIRFGGDPKGKFNLTQHDIKDYQSISSMEEL